MKHALIITVAVGIPVFLWLARRAAIAIAAAVLINVNGSRVLIR